MSINKSRLYIPGLGGLYESLWDIVWLLLRLAAGLIVVPHGMQKLFGMFGGGGLTGTAAFFDKIGYSPGSVWAPVVGCVEFFGGLLLAIGLFTRPVAFILAGEMAVAYFYAHAHKGFWPVDNGGELAAICCFVYLFLAAAGPGAWSVDGRIARGRASG